MSNLDRCLSHTPQPDLHPFWLLVPGVACAALIVWLKLQGGVTHYEPSVRHASPDPYVPQCYWVQGMQSDYYTFKVGR